MAVGLQVVDEKRNSKILETLQALLDTRMRDAMQVDVALPCSHLLSVDCISSSSWRHAHCLRTDYCSCKLTAWTQKIEREE